MNAPNQSGWKPAMIVSQDGMHNGPATTTGNRALMLEEPLLFDDRLAPEVTGVDLPPIDASAANRLGGLERAEPIGLVGLTEPETVATLHPAEPSELRHRPRLLPARQLHHASTPPRPQREGGGACPAFADIHPLAPQNAVQGALEVISQLGKWLCMFDRDARCRDEPQGGAHGEL